MRKLLILTTIGFMIVGQGTAQAHRLSGHPRTLKAKLAIAKTQLRHDRISGTNHWIAKDRAYVKKLQRLMSFSALPPHYAGWSCITNGAYPGAPHEGHGYNGPYSGPLQMTNPWLGNYAPNGDWNSVSDVTVYWVAEKVAARYGFAYSFMRGQWPNTYPPCAGRF